MHRADDRARPAGRLAQWARVALPLTALRVVGQGTEFAGWVVLARELGTADFGRLSVAFLVARYAGLVADWGASTRGARDVAGASSEVRPLLRRRAQVGAVLAAAYAAVAVWSGFPSFAPLAATVLARGLSRDWVALGRERGMRAGTPSAVQGFAVAGLAAFAGSPGAGAVALAIGYAAGTVASVALNRLPPAPRADRVDVDGWMLTSSLADQVVATSDTMLLAALRSPAEAGVYAAVYRIPNAVMTVTGLLVTGLIPLATRAVLDDRGRLAAIRRDSFRVGAVGAALVAVLAPAVYALVPAVFGEQYRDGRTVGLVLMLAMAAVVLVAPLVAFYLAARRDRDLALITLLGAGTNLALNLVFIPAWGMNGAALSTLVALVVVAGAHTVVTARIAGRAGGPVEPSRMDKWMRYGPVGPGPD